jgi:hypothetical protein
LSVYRRHALRHIVQAFVLVIPATLALLTLSVLVPLVMLLVGEVLIIALLPRTAWFRRRVDEHLRELNRAEATAARAALLGRMSDEHRIELERLERLAAQIRERSVTVTADVDGALNEWLGLGRLFAAYVRLAIAHNSSTISFRAVDRVALNDHVARLESAQMAATDRTRLWIDRRLAIARRRVDAWERAREERELMAHGLATIGELVRWMYEQSATTPTEPVRAELEDTLATWEHNGTTLHELSALCDGYDAIDVKVFELGHEPLGAASADEMGGPRPHPHHMCANAEAPQVQ